MASLIASDHQLVKFDNQIAGHDRLLQLSTTDLLVIKPCTRTELDFYETAQQYPEFTPWIPQCFGSLRSSTEAEKQLLNNEKENEGVVPIPGVERPRDTQGRALDEHLCLENLLHGFTRPCIMDIKLGDRLYDDDADEEKRKKMQANAKGTTIETLAARISGMKVYDTVDRAWSSYPKAYGRSRTQDTILDAFLAYFFPTSAYAKAPEENRTTTPDEEQPAEASSSLRKKLTGTKMRWIIESLVEDIASMVEFLEAYPAVELIGASLLIVYEGDSEAANRVWKKLIEEDNREAQDKVHDEEDEEEEEEEEPKLYDVRLIDFAHSRWDVDRTTQDAGLLKGFQNVLRLLNECLDRQRSEKL